MDLEQPGVSTFGLSASQLDMKQQGYPKRRQICTTQQGVMCYRK
jgi:hypothetical protein